MELHRVRRRRGAGLLAVGLAASGLVISAAPTGAVENVTSERVAGIDRWATAAEVAEAAFPDGSATVLVASGRSFPDALAGAALGLPILLTERDDLPSATAQAIDDLGATDAIILGGTAVVSARVENELDGMVDVSRIAGANRYETAARLAEAAGAGGVAEIDGLATAIVATGADFADALAGGPLASGADGGDAVIPVLLVADDVPAPTADAIEELGIEQVLILGGTGAVSSAVAAELEDLTGNDPVRLAGTNRFATAVAVAEFALETLEFPGEEVLLANGLVFADALAGGPLGGIRQAPILLTPTQPLASQTATFLEQHADTVETITTLGGTAAVASSTADAAEDAAESEVPEAKPTNEALTVNPQASADVANGSSRDYTVATTSPVDIVLVECNDVTRTPGAATTFRNANSNTVADGTASAGDDDNVDHASVANAYISSVNGTARQSVQTPAQPNNDYADNVAPSNGVVAFTVTGPSASSTASVCVRPVVFVDANVDNALNVPTAGTQPSEAFGVGGQTLFSRSAAGAGQFGNHNVTSVNKAIDRFTACAIVTQSGGNELVDEDDCKDYRYDSNDNFQIASVPTSFAEWEAALSVNDDVRGTYAPDAAGVSTFNLTDDDSSGGAPLLVSAQGRDANNNTNVGNGDLHRLTFSEPLVASAATSGSYTVRDGGTPLPTEYTIECGENATCSLSGSVLTVGLTETPMFPNFDSPGTDGVLTYPLTITETTGMKDAEGAEGKETNVAESTDVTIEHNSLNEARPYITAAKMSADELGPGNYGAVNDAMALTFSEAITLVGGSDVSVAEFEAITGRDVTYGPATVVTGTVSGSVLTLTVSGGNFTSGINVGQTIDGTSNSFVVDAANNPQQPNPTADPQLQSAS